jgi:hypothetical protein
MSHEIWRATRQTSLGWERDDTSVNCINCGRTGDRGTEVGARILSILRGCTRLGSGGRSTQVDPVRPSATGAETCR